jgi:hypothetical protein
MEIFAEPVKGLQTYPCQPSPQEEDYHGACRNDAFFQHFTQPAIMKVVKILEGPGGLFAAMEAAARLRGQAAEAAPGGPVPGSEPAESYAAGLRPPGAEGGVVTALHKDDPRWGRYFEPLSSFLRQHAQVTGRAGYSREASTQTVSSWLQGGMNPAYFQGMRRDCRVTLYVEGAALQMPFDVSMQVQRVVHVAPLPSAAKDKEAVLMSLSNAPELLSIVHPADPADKARAFLAQMDEVVSRVEANPSQGKACLPDLVCGLLHRLALLTPYVSGSTAIIECLVRGVMVHLGVTEQPALPKHWWWLAQVTSFDAFQAHLLVDWPEACLGCSSGQNRGPLPGPWMECFIFPEPEPLLFSPEGRFLGDPPAVPQAGLGAPGRK